MTYESIFFIISTHSLFSRSPTLSAHSSRSSFIESHFIWLHLAHLRETSLVCSIRFHPIKRKLKAPRMCRIIAILHYRLVFLSLILRLTQPSRGRIKSTFEFLPIKFSLRHPSSTCSTFALTQSSDIVRLRAAAATQHRNSKHLSPITKPVDTEIKHKISITQRRVLASSCSIISECFGV